MPAGGGIDIATLGLRVDNRQGVQALGEFDRAMDKTSQKSSSTMSVLGKLGVALGLTTVGMMIVKSTSEAQHSLAQLEAGVKSTGFAAGKTVAELEAMSSALQRNSTYSDEAVKHAQALLLTFTQIKGDQFDAATQAVVDLSTKMGGDLQGAAIQVGKALNDPILGVTALRKVGVSFTESQQEMIKTLVESGKMVEAQSLVLKELQVEFGGSAAAARNTFGGALSFAKNALGELLEMSSRDTGGLVKGLNALGEAALALKDNITTVIEVMKVLVVMFAAHYLAEYGAKLQGVIDAHRAMVVAQRAEVAAATLQLNARKASLSAQVVAGRAAWQLAAAENAVAAAELRVAATQRALTVSTSILTRAYIGLAAAAKLAWAAIGGWIGVAVIAAYGAYKAFKHFTKEGVDPAIEQQKKLNDTMVKFNSTISGSSVADLKKRIEGTKTAIAALITTIGPGGIKVMTPEQLQVLTLLNAQLRTLFAEVETAQQRERDARDAAAAKLQEYVDTLVKLAAGSRDAWEHETLRTEAVKQAESAERQINEALRKTNLSLAQRTELLDALRKAQETTGLGVDDPAAIARLKSATDGLRPALVQSMGYGTIGSVESIGNAVRDELVSVFGITIRKSEHTATEMEELFKEAVRGIQQAFSKGWRSIFDEGLGGFRQFTDTLLDSFKDVAAQIAGALTARALGINDLVKNIENGTVGLFGKGMTGGQQRMAGAMVGLAAGSYLGGQTTSRFGGAAMGAMGGAAAGFAVGGPWGAAAGAVTGLVSGIMGASDAARKAAESMRQFKASMEAVNMELHNASQLEREKFRAQQWYEGERQKILDMDLPDIKQNPMLAELRSTYNAMLAKIVEDTERATQKIQEDLEVRRLRASGQDDAADAAAFFNAQQREVEEALRAGADAATRAAMALTHAAETEAFRAQQAEKAAQRSEDVALRIANARGEDTRAMAMEIEHRRELVGVTDASVSALIKLAQAEEELALVRQLAEEKTQVIEDLNTRQARARGEDTRMLELEISHRRELVGVTDEALIAVIKYTQGLEASALATAIAAERLQQATDFQNDLTLRRLALEDETAESIRIKHEIRAAGEIAAAQKLLDAGTISQEAFDELIDLLGDEGVAAVQAFNDAIRQLASDLEADITSSWLKEFGKPGEFEQYQADADKKARDDKILDYLDKGIITQEKANEYLSKSDDLYDAAVKGITDGMEQVAQVQRDRAPIEDQAKGEVIKSIAGMTETAAVRWVDIGLSQLAVMNQIELNTRGGAGGGTQTIGTALTVNVSFNGDVTTSDPLGLAQVIAGEVNRLLGQEAEWEAKNSGTAT